MYREQIRNLERLVEEQTINISKLSKENPNYITMVDQRSTNMQELSRLRRLQWEEDHERVGYDDDR